MTAFLSFISATLMTKKSEKTKMTWGEHEKDGAEERNRTSDLLITNQLLYQLSYFGFQEDKL